MQGKGENMKATQVKKTLELSIKINRPVFLWGSPGIGKSQVVAQVAKDAELPVIDVRAVLLDPVDLRGLPHINGDNKAHWATPEFLPQEERDGKRGVLFLDELNAAPPLVQAACYQLILDRKLGEYELPEGWAIIAAGNLETDRAVTHRMPSALANRFLHINMVADLDDWVSWALSNDIQTELIAFLRFRPELLHKFDPKTGEKSFPTPRSWEFISDILAVSPEDAIQYELFSGTVGEGATSELLSFIKIFQNLPNPDRIFLDPDNSPVPEDPATLYAICGALSQKVTSNTIDTMMRYADRLPPEFSVLLVRDSMQKDHSILNTRAFIEWSERNKDVLL